MFCKVESGQTCYRHYLFNHVYMCLNNTKLYKKIICFTFCAFTIHIEQHTAMFFSVRNSFYFYYIYIRVKYKKVNFFNVGFGVE